MGLDFVRSSSNVGCEHLLQPTSYDLSSGKNKRTVDAYQPYIGRAASKASVRARLHPLARSVGAGRLLVGLFLSPPITRFCGESGGETSGVGGAPLDGGGTQRYPTRRSMDVYRLPYHYVQPVHVAIRLGEDIRPVDTQLFL